MSGPLDDELSLLDAPVADRERPQVRLVGRQRADQVEGVGPALGKVDVGLRWVGGAAGMGVVDAHELFARFLDLAHDADLVARVDDVPQGALLGVARPEGPARAPVAAGDEPAALIRRVLAGVGHDLVDQLAGDAHRPRLATAIWRTVLAN